MRVNNLSGLRIAVLTGESLLPAGKFWLATLVLRALRALRAGVPME